jgi:hypothetical protein
MMLWIGHLHVKYITRIKEKRRGVTNDLPDHPETDIFGLEIIDFQV